AVERLAGGAPRTVAVALAGRAAEVPVQGGVEQAVVLLAAALTVVGAALAEGAQRAARARRRVAVLPRRAVEVALAAGDLGDAQAGVVVATLLCPEVVGVAAQVGQADALAPHLVAAQRATLGVDVAGAAHEVGGRPRV